MWKTGFGNGTVGLVSLAPTLGWVVVLASALVLGCSSPSGTPIPDSIDTPPACVTNAECDDGDRCNGDEACDPEKGCVAGEPLVCDDKDLCNGVEGCDVVEGCTAGEPLVCDDEDACNGVETCEAAEGCVAAEALVCDDQMPCNGVETCDAVTGCVQGTPPEGCCSSDTDCDDKDVCTGQETCDLTTNTCVLEPLLVCDDDNACTGIETCDPEQGCIVGTPLVCDDQDACTGIETCEAATGCVAGPALTCDDEDACNGVETCDTLAGCVAGTPLVCDDNDACTGVETCNTATGCVAGTPLVCDDNDACTGIETCVAVTGCVAGTPLVCADNDACTVDTCDFTVNTDSGCIHTVTEAVPEVTVEGIEEGGVANGSVTLVVTIEDLPNLGVDYSLDGQPFQPGTSVSAEGEHKFDVTVTTCQGDTVTVTHTFTIDSAPPVITAVIDPPPNAAGWHNTPVTVTWEATDATSGVSTVTAPTVVATPGANIVVKGTATDAGGLTSELEVSLKLDLKSPTVTITSPVPNQEGDDQLVVASTAVTISGVISDDALSGFAGGLLTSSKTKEKVIFDTPGGYSEDLQLTVGINTVIVSVTDIAGNAGTASICIIVDNTKPQVTIQYPPTGYKTTTDQLDVSGVAHDLVVGSVTGEDVTVFVNGMEATIDNSQFIVTGVPLLVGSNDITATATDSVGQTSSHTIHVTRVDESVKHLKIISGNNQSGPIFTTLPEPLVVQLLNSEGSPISNHNVVFGVTNNDGTIAHPDPVMMSPKKWALVAMTDAEGLAEVSLTLGSRAGQAVNRVTVSADGAVSSVSFFANGSADTALNIHGHSGLNQIGAVGEPLPLPLSVVVTDAGDNPVAGQPVTFAVVKGNSKLGGGQAVTVLSNANGFADVVVVLGIDEGYSTHAFKASIPTDPEGPSGTKRGVVFNASAFEAGDPAQTRLRGRVLDEDEKPVKGVLIRFPELGDIGIDAETDENGFFTYLSAPAGFSIMEVDGTAAAPLASDFSFPNLTYEVHNVPGILNELDRPIFMLRLNKGTYVDGMTDVEIGIKELPGFVLSIPAGTKLTFPDGSHKGEISITQVHFDQAPMAPIDGLQSRILVTIQPPGVHFDPPAPLTVPNADNYPPAKKVEMFSFDHDLESFVSIGTGTVSNDGTIIKSDPGVGVVKGGWHCGADPQSSGECENCPKPSASASAGSITIAASGQGSAKITASGSPGKGTTWAFTKECGNFTVSGGPCAEQSSCKGKVSGGNVLRGRVLVTHTCTESGDSASTTVDVNECEVPGTEEPYKYTFGKDKDGNTKSEGSLTALFANIIIGAKNTVESTLGCKSALNYNIGGSIEARGTCCSGCEGVIALEGGGNFNVGAEAKLECAIPGLSVPFVKKLGITAGLVGVLSLKGKLEGGIRGSGCCDKPPCVCASGSASAAIDGEVKLKLAKESGGSSIVNVSGGVGVGVGVNATISCSQACFEGCFNGLKLIWEVGFANGFFSAKGEHYLVCPKSLAGGCTSHSLASYLPIGAPQGCGSSTDVCGAPEPPPVDKQKPNKPPPSTCGTPKGCEDSCVSNCGENNCGADLCGGSCGTCDADEVCSDGTCEAVLF